MKQILLLASLWIAFASCTKSNPAKDNYENLLTGEWAITDYTVRFEKLPGVDSVYDIYRNFDTCRYDDKIAFRANYKGAQFAGKNNCAGELDSTVFDWKLSDNQTKLILNNAQYTIGNFGKSTITFPPVEYIEAKITKINSRSFTITYDKTFQEWIPTSPNPGEGIFVEQTFYFTQVFTKR